MPLEGPAGAVASRLRWGYHLVRMRQEPPAGSSDLVGLTTTPRFDRSVERAVLERNFSTLDVAARRFWEAVSVAGGRAEILGGGVGWNKTPEGLPVLHRDLDGAVFPIQAVADLYFGDEVWRAELRPSGLRKDELEVRLTFPVSGLDAAERLLEVGVPRRVVLQHEGVTERTLAATYERLRAIAERLEPTSLSSGELPSFTVTPEGRLVPVKLALVATVRGRVFRFEVDSRSFFRPRVSVECDADMQGQARQLLGPPETSREASEPHADTAAATVARCVDLSGYDWDRVGGLAEVKHQLEEWVEAPLANPELFRLLGLRPPKGVLLCGPPGTGKTLLAKVLSCRTRAAFLYATPRDLLSMWFGQSERLIGRLFDEARTAASARGRALLFLDEIDGLFGSRDREVHEATRRIMAQLLTELDGLAELSGVTVLAATNRLQDVDAALLRPGRFDRLVEVPLPDREARGQVLAVHLRGKPLADDVHPALLAEASDGLSGADIEEVVARATFAAARRVAARRGGDLASLAGPDLAEIRIANADLMEAVADLRRERKRPAAPRRRRSQIGGANPRSGGGRR